MPRTKAKTPDQTPDAPVLATRPQNRHLRGGDPTTFGLTPLAEGEATKPVRVRAKADTLAWWEQWTAEERGRLVEQLIASGARP